MKTLDYLGLDVQATLVTVKELQQLLADLHVFYMNMRGYHWHIEGEKFFVLHEKFEEIYDDLAEQIDEVAERILMLGGYPQNKFSELLKTAQIKEESLVKGYKESVQGTLNSFKVIIEQIKKVVDVAEKADDQRTQDLVTAYLEQYEKKTWMFVAFMK